MHTTAQLDSLELDESPGQAPKRGMIFRIEQLLPGSTPTTSAPAAAVPLATTTTTTTLAATTTITAQSLPKRSRPNLRPGVYTAQYTPKETCSVGINTTALLACMATPMPSDSHAHCTLVNGELAMSATLLRQIKLSEDIYSFNALFELHGGLLRIRLVRDVAREDEIVAWFGEELVLLMSIPFLTPLNIQGKQQQEAASLGQPLLISLSLRLSSTRQQSLHLPPVPSDLRDTASAEDSSGTELWSQCHGSAVDAPALCTQGYRPLDHDNVDTLSASAHHLHDVNFVCLPHTHSATNGIGCDCSTRYTNTLLCLSSACTAHDQFPARCSSHTLLPALHVDGCSARGTSHECSCTD